MVLAQPGQGIIDGTIITNIYLGHSVESYVSTSTGEILVQIDNPAQKKIPSQGEAVSIQIVPELAKVLHRQL
jgi:iron(III) transport system ATP-binding protein